MGFSLKNKGMSIRNSIRSIRKFLNRQHKKHLAVLSVLIFFSAIFDVFGLASILPVISAAANPSLIHSNSILNFIYDYFHFASERTFLLSLILTLFILFILKSAFGIFVTYLQSKYVTDIAVDLSLVQFDKYFSLQYEDFQSTDTAIMMRDIVMNVNTYVQWIVISLITLATELFIVLLIIGGIAVYNFQLFVFIIAIVGPATWLVSRIIRKYSEQVGVGINDNYAKSVSEISQALMGYVDIKLSAHEEHYKARYLKYQRPYQWLMLKLFFLNLVPFRTNEIIALLGILVIFFYSLLFSENSAQILTLVGLFAAAAYRLMPSINRIINSLNFLNVNQVSIHYMENFYDTYLKNISGLKAQKPVSFLHEISFENLAFKFPNTGRSVFKNISFKVKKGEKVGFIGSSGSGKTTLMNLLLRFYKEDAGGIYSDGVKLDDENIIDWRRKIGYVKQDIFIMDGTIRENIAFGEEQVDEQKLQLAIRQASLHDFVESLPEKDLTQVGERGSKLSGGQKQRIGIARSLYRNAEILVFDEATSALDMQTENEVTEAIDRLSESNKTIFIIAHRITTLKNCHRIYELANGTISGTFDYQKLVERVM